MLFCQSVTVWSSGDVLSGVIPRVIESQDLLQSSLRPSWRSRAAAAAVQSVGSPSLAKAESQTAVISSEKRNQWTTGWRDMVMFTMYMSVYQFIHQKRVNHREEHINELTVG